MLTNIHPSMKLEDQLLTLSRELQELGLDLYVQAFKNEGIAALTIGQFRYLEIIAQNPGITPTKLADHFIVKKPTTAVVIRELEARKLIYREKTEEDGRIYQLCITESAVRIFAHRNRMYKILADRIRRILPEDEVIQLQGFLAKVIGDPKDS